MQSGWTQSLQKWTVQKDSAQTGDTIIQYNFLKKDLLNLRLYVTSLEEYKAIAPINEAIIAKQKQELNKYAELVLNKDVIIEEQKQNYQRVEEINKNLQIKVDKYAKQAKAWPYWLGGGFVGGIILCLSIK